MMLSASSRAWNYKSNVWSQSTRFVMILIDLSTVSKMSISKWICSPFRENKIYKIE